MTPTKINLAEKLSTFSDYFSPRTIAKYNDCDVMVVKAKGEFVWHHHEAEDELFLVLKSSLMMRFRDKDVLVEEGEFIIVPRGIEHLPVADEEVHIMLLEPKSTLNTGNVESERTHAELDRI